MDIKTTRFVVLAKSLFIFFILFFFCFLFFFNYLIKLLSIAFQKKQQLESNLHFLTTSVHTWCKGLNFPLPFLLKRYGVLVLSQRFLELVFRKRNDCTYATNKLAIASSFFMLNTIKESEVLIIYFSGACKHCDNRIQYNS